MYERQIVKYDRCIYHCDACGKRYCHEVKYEDGNKVDSVDDTGPVKTFAVSCPWPVGEHHESCEIELNVCSRECLMQVAGEILWPANKGGSVGE